MLRLKVSALLCVLCSVIILVGFLLLNTTSYTVYGNMAFQFGLGLLTLVNIINLIAGGDPNRKLMSKELHIFEVATVVVQISGLYLSCIDVIMNTRPILWVGIVGSSLMIIGNVMSFLKELWLERLEKGLVCPEF